ncbi:MAG: N-acetylglucosamine kinase [Bacillota bacterium]
MLVGGVDAGGTKTECIIYDTEKEKVITRTLAGPANFQTAGIDKSCQEIKKALEKALQNIGKTQNKISLLGIGMAGAGRKNDKRKMKEKLNELSGVKEIHLTDDGMIALMGATGGEKGIIITAGTGSIAYGLREDGKVVRSGGWGPLIGDEGGGFWLGIQAVKKAVKASGGRANPTELTQIVKSFFELKKLTELIPFIYSQELQRRQIASLAPEVIKLAQRGDSTALKIIHKGITELSLLVLSVKERLDYRETKVAFNGGLFTNEYYSNLFKEKMEKDHGLTVYKPEYSATRGAVFYALNKYKS